MMHMRSHAMVNVPRGLRWATCKLPCWFCFFKSLILSVWTATAGMNLPLPLCSPRLRRWDFLSVMDPTWRCRWEMCCLSRASMDRLTVLIMLETKEGWYSPIRRGCAGIACAPFSWMETLPCCCCFFIDTQVFGHRIDGRCDSDGIPSSLPLQQSQTPAPNQHNC